MILLSLAISLLFVTATGSPESLQLLQKRLDTAKTDELRYRIIKNELYRPGRFSASEYARFARVALEISRRLGNRDFEAESLHLCGLGHIKENKYEESMECFFQARRLHREGENWRRVGDMNQEIGHLFQFAFSDYPRALDFYEKARQVYVENGIRQRLFSVLNNTAEVHDKAGNQVQAVEYLLRALRVGETNTSKLERAGLLTNLAEVYQDLQNEIHSREYLQQALNIYLEENHFNGQGRIHFILGKWEQTKENRRQAESHLQKALDFFSRYKNRHGISQAQHQLGVFRAEAGDAGNAFAFFRQALDTRTESRDFLGRVQTLLAMGRLAQKTGDFSTAREYLRESLELSLEKGFNNELKEVYAGFSSLSSVLGDNSSALRYQRLAQETSDKVAGSRITGKVMGLLLTYEQTRINSRMSRFKRNLVWAAGLLLLLALALVLSARRRANAGMRSARDQILQLKQALDSLQKQIDTLDESPDREKYEKSGLSLVNARRLLQGFLRLMEQERLFLDPELTLKLVCERLYTNSSYLSQVINEHLGTSFKDFVNHLRVEEAKRLLIDSKTQNLTIITVGFEAGFNSKDAFARAFKKFTGVTPKEFRKRDT